MTRYYCAVFYFARGSERENILSDTDAAFVATALILCLKKNKKIHHSTEELYKRRPQSNTRKLATFLRLSEPNNYKILLLLNGSSFDKLLKTAASKIAERSSKMQEAVTLSGFIHYATLFNL
jgi:hypothetical protein